MILEPDALLHLVDGCTLKEFHEECYDLLKGAIQRRAALAVTVGLAGTLDPQVGVDPFVAGLSATAPSPLRDGPEAGP